MERKSFQTEAARAAPLGCTKSLCHRLTKDLLKDFSEVVTLKTLKTVEKRLKKRETGKRLEIFFVLENGEYTARNARNTRETSEDRKNERM